jgi:ParB-like chromosome segregation protein Spo0J
LLAELKAKAAQGSPADRPRELPVRAIKRVPALFQPRRNREDERHIDALARAVRSVGKLDPILVMYIGPDPYLIDGHHRLAAYEVAGITAPVPVVYFEGQLEAALLEAGRENSKAKLPMSGQERQDYAWRLVLLGGYSKSQTMEAAGVSDGQVAIMRRVKAALGDAAYSCQRWFQALRRARGEDERQWTDEDRQEWREGRATWLVDQIAKACGPKLTDDPEVAAMALERLFGRRIGELAWELRDHLPEEAEEDAFADF